MAIETVEVTLEELEADPRGEEQAPSVRMVPLNDGARVVLNDLRIKYNKKAQVLEDKDPDLTERYHAYWVTRTKAAEEAGDDFDGSDFDNKLTKLGEPVSAIWALNGEAVALTDWWITRRLAVVIKRIGGKWSLLDSDLDDKPPWPKLDFEDPGAALDVRVRLLRHVCGNDKRRLLEAMNDFLNSGSGGLTEEQKGN